MQFGCRNTLLFKDIAEIEELVAEKGAEGFDKFEIDWQYKLIDNYILCIKQCIMKYNQKFGYILYLCNRIKNDFNNLWRN